MNNADVFSVIFGTHVHILYMIDSSDTTAFTLSLVIAVVFILSACSSVLYFNKGLGLILR